MTQQDMTRRRFLGATTAGALAMTGLQTAGARPRNIGLTAWDAFPDTTATFAVADPAHVKLLQLTDIHFFCPHPDPQAGNKTLDALSRLVELTEPDLVAVTGDLWQDNPAGRGEEFMRYSVEQLGKLGVPWLFTWGNHDDMNDFAAGHEALTNTPHSLYRGGPERGNYVVYLTDRAGNPVWDLICLNSTERGLQQDQHQWLRQLQHTWDRNPHAQHAFALFHIPLQQQDALWNAGQAGGVKFESVQYEEEAGDSFAFLRDFGSIRACFCGHDHVNDFSGRRDGIDLVYGRATGYQGYGGTWVPKGGKLVTMNAESGAYDWVSVLPDGTRWRETPGEQVAEPDQAPWAEPAPPTLGSGHLEDRPRFSTGD